MSSLTSLVLLSGTIVPSGMGIQCPSRWAWLRGCQSRWHSWSRLFLSTEQEGNRAFSDPGSPGTWLLGRVHVSFLTHLHASLTLKTVRQFVTLEVLGTETLLSPPPATMRGQEGAQVERPPVGRVHFQASKRSPRGGEQVLPFLPPAPDMLWACHTTTMCWGQSGGMCACPGCTVTAWLGTQ